MSEVSLWEDTFAGVKRYHVVEPWLPFTKLVKAPPIIGVRGGCPATLFLLASDRLFLQYLPRCLLVFIPVMELQMGTQPWVRILIYHFLDLKACRPTCPLETTQ